MRFALLVANENFEAPGTEQNQEEDEDEEGQLPLLSTDKSGRADDISSQLYRPNVHSFSPAVGSGSGTEFNLQGNDIITAVRCWEQYSSYISGFQLRFGYIWTPIVGYAYGSSHEIELFDGENIIQISGTHAHYIQSLIFVTSKHRLLIVGRSAGHSFNIYPKYMDSYLVFLSGRVHGALTGLMAHWGTFSPNSTDA
ncbi:zymogen granule membrane protein 16-like [Thalassophryne amazonica]|uniref:zymogen granule membrane protein 16-like n=1 Tax=Thalassophryne amazonica TaxID=390379 RepID=UPI0014725D19|nr:zymogen granule membrane protein 16-like [Thalassophryne amazonica]